MTRDEVFAAIKARGAVKAVVEFSGGADEGGADRVILLDADETQIAELHEHYRNHEYVNGKWVEHPFPDDVLEEGELVEELVRPVYDSYGGFGGNFYVNGTLIWNAENQTVHMNGSEQGAWTPFSRDID